MKDHTVGSHPKPSTELVTSTTEAPVRCPDNITKQLLEGETTASVSWRNDYGDVMRVKLPVGDHNFEQMAQDGTKCAFTVSITGNLHVELYNRLVQHTAVVLHTLLLLQLVIRVYRE
jgi:hypothetical protein